LRYFIIKSDISINLRVFGHILYPYMYECVYSYIKFARNELLHIAKRLRYDLKQCYNYRGENNKYNCLFTDQSDRL